MSYRNPAIILGKMTDFEVVLGLLAIAMWHRTKDS
jgi:hypothetical protein